MTVCDLSARDCVPCQGGIAPLDRAGAESALADAGLAAQGWALSADATALTRRWEFKGFAKAVQMANAAAFLGDRQGHHPDIRFGWGYCEVTFTTHEAGGLTENDLICAAKLDAMLAL